MKPAESPSSGRALAFTLIELLAVVAVIGILTAILIPTVVSVRQSAQRTRTKTQFAQWAAAMELFRQEYGYYPAIATDGKVDPAKFAPALLGRLNFAGDPLPDAATPADLGGNLRRIAFLALTADDLDPSRTSLVDAFGNSDLAVRVDVNQDGRIDSTDTGGGYLATWPTVQGAHSASFSPADADAALGAGPLLGRVAFYSAGAGRSAADLILSWR